MTKKRADYLRSVLFNGIVVQLSSCGVTFSGSGGFPSVMTVKLYWLLTTFFYGHPLLLGDYRFDVVRAEDYCFLHYSSSDARTASRQCSGTCSIVICPALIFFTYNLTIIHLRSIPPAPEWHLPAWRFPLSAFLPWSCPARKSLLCSGSCKSPHRPDPLWSR